MVTASPGRSLCRYTRALDGFEERHHTNINMAAPSANRFASPVRRPRKLFVRPRCNRFMQIRIGDLKWGHMRNEKFVRVVVWLVVISMVLTLAISFGSLLFS